MLASPSGERARQRWGGTVSTSRISALLAVLLLTFVSMAQACKVSPSSAARLAAWVEQSRKLGASVLEPHQWRPLQPNEAAPSDGLALQLPDSEPLESVATLHTNVVSSLGFQRAVAPRSTSATGHSPDVPYAPHFLVASILATGPPSHHS
jgi:hypothetical protein